MKGIIRVVLLVVIFVLAGLCRAQGKALTMSGFVTDQNFRAVEGASVVIVGHKANADTTTDSEGAFVVSLAQGVEEGNTVRIRIEKPGYKSYDKLIAVSSAIPLRVSLESIRAGVFNHALQAPIERTVSISTLVPFHGEWKNTPIPMNENLTDPHQEFYDSLLELSSRPDKQPEGWGAYKDRKFESLDYQYAFVTRLIQFDVFRSIYFMQKGVAGGIKWTAGAGVTPINKPPIIPPNSVQYPTKELLEALSGNEFLKPGDQMLWNNNPLVAPLGTRVSFQETSSPANGQVLTCTVRLERPGYFKLDFEIQPGLGMNDQLPVGFSTQTVQGTTTFSVNIAMKYAIQRRRDSGFQAEQYAAWAEALFSGLKRRMAFESESMASSGTIEALNVPIFVDKLSDFMDAGASYQRVFLEKNDASLIAQQESAWDTSVQAYLSTNLGKSYASQFRSVQSASAVYPTGHSIEGGSVYNLISVKNEILTEFVKELRSTMSPKSTLINSAPNGIAVSGGIVNNPTVNTFGTLPQPTPTVTVCLLQSSPPNVQQHVTTITLRTSVKISQPWYAFFFDGPVLEGGVEMDTASFGYTHGRADKMSTPENTFLFGNTSTNFGNGAWLPGQTIKVTVPSKDQVHLTRIMSGSEENGLEEKFLFRCD